MRFDDDRPDFFRSTCRFASRFLSVSLRSKRLRRLKENCAFFVFSQTRTQTQQNAQAEPTSKYQMIELMTATKNRHLAPSTRVSFSCREKRTVIVLSFPLQPLFYQRQRARFISLWDLWDTGRVNRKNPIPREHHSAYRHKKHKHTHTLFIMHTLYAHRYTYIYINIQMNVNIRTK